MSTPKTRILTAASFLFVASGLPASPAGAVTTTSPDGKVAVVVSTDAAGHLQYSVNANGISIVEPSRLGITVEGKDLGNEVILGQASASTIRDSYPLAGVHSTAHNYCSESVIPVLAGADKTPWSLEVRAYDDGAAYRYRVPGEGSRQLDGETSSWVLAANAKAWFQNDLGSYEGLYTGTTVGEIPPGTVVAFPAVFQLPASGLYVALTEANLVNYSDMVVQSAKDHSLQALFYADSKGWVTQGEIVSPWRVTIVARDLNALVNSDIVHNLCPPPSPELAHADWIAPGRSVWQWWNSGDPKLGEQHQWVDWTKQIGFEYYLIDENWERWKSPDGKDQWTLLKEVVDYAGTQGVKVIIWVHSRQVFKPEDRQAYFARARDCGVAGLKIDFPPKGSVGVVNWYVDSLRDAAALHLVVDFHGAIKPTGLDRTWPNEINREAIRGHEYQINRYHRTLPPEHDAILPFARYLAGHADYTPTVFKPEELRGYTWPHELAQAVVFTSPFLCYADYPPLYLQNPALDVMQAIPPVWDETVVLPGSEIGKVAAFARRKGDAWFIGVLNGGDARRLEVDLKFLSPRPFRLVKVEDVPEKDDALQKSFMVITATDHLDLRLNAMGGFVGWLTPTAPPSH